MKASIHCPKHGLQLSNPNTKHAIACEKCFPRAILKLRDEIINDALKELKNGANN